MSTGADRSIRIWNPATHRLLTDPFLIEGPGAALIALDGGRLAVAAGQAIVMFRLNPQIFATR